jgi:DNA invertase Pin-like site-specific DNA recombinase
MGKGMPIMIFGYARVSTDGQTLDAQQATLTAAGAEKVFAEKVSGAQTDRKKLRRYKLAIDKDERESCIRANLLRTIRCRQLDLRRL